MTILTKPSEKKAGDKVPLPLHDEVAMLHGGVSPQAYEVCKMFFFFSSHILSISIKKYCCTKAKNNKAI